MSMVIVAAGLALGLMLVWLAGTSQWRTGRYPGGQV